MISVAIVGNGNVGSHLWKAFQKVDDIEVTQINSRALDTHRVFDVIIIAVTDDAILDVSSHIENSFVAHTSGSVEMSALQNSGNKGVIYPLQSFSKDKKIDFTKVPFCLEAENDKDMKVLEKLVKALKGNVFHFNSEQRKSIHVAAVFVNNFANHMYTIAHDICKQYDVPFDILESLIQETSKKIQVLSPLEAQTGPAKRNDTETIQNHLALLNKAQQEIYLKLTESIQEHGKKL